MRCRSDLSLSPAVKVEGGQLDSQPKDYEARSIPVPVQGTDFHQVFMGCPQADSNCRPCLRRAKASAGMVPMNGNFRMISTFFGHRESLRNDWFSTKCCHFVATAGFSAAPSCCQTDVYAERKHGTKYSSCGQPAPPPMPAGSPPQLVARITVLGKDRVAASRATKRDLRAFTSRIDRDLPRYEFDCVRIGWLSGRSRGAPD